MATIDMPKEFEKYEEWIESYQYPITAKEGAPKALVKAVERFNRLFKRVSIDALSGNEVEEEKGRS